MKQEHFNDHLSDRTLSMAAHVHKLLFAKRIIGLSRPMALQVVRSSSSVAANFRAATRARSDAEFYAKICIVVEECDETQFWFDYLLCIGGIVQAEEIAELRTEEEELVRIFSSMKKTMKGKLEGRKTGGEM